MIDRLSKDCPNCDNVGWYVVVNTNTGEAEQEQCQFCYEEPYSVFNLINQQNFEASNDWLEGGEY